VWTRTSVLTRPVGLGGVQNLAYVRMDGTLADRKERQRRVVQFQSDARIPCFLLTTGVGGVGLNLTGADRVVLMDPAWNPAKDAQAVDRAYRMGQTRPVVVYRLNTCGTVEEKVFRRQVYKASLMRNTTTKAGSSQRYACDGASVRGRPCP
jgi:DNA excision repair protein ERCC-6-like